MANEKTLKKFTVQVPKEDDPTKTENVSCNFDDSLVPGLQKTVGEQATAIEEVKGALGDKLSKADFNKTPASKISDEDIEHWNTPVVTEETDPTVKDFIKAITEADIAKWDAGGVSYKSTYLANLKDMRSVDLLNSGLIAFNPAAVGSQYIIDETVAIADPEESEEIEALSDEAEEVEAVEDGFAQLGPHFYDYTRGTYELCDLQENDIIFFYADSLVATAVVVRHSDGMKYLRDISSMFDMQDYYLDDTDERSTTKYVDTEKENGTLRLVPVILYLADQCAELENRIAAIERQLPPQPVPEPDGPETSVKTLNFAADSADIVPSKESEDQHGVTGTNCVLQYKFECKYVAAAKHIEVANASFDFSTNNGEESGTFSQVSDAQYPETDLMRTNKDNTIKFYNEENGVSAYMYLVGGNVICDIPWYFPDGVTDLDDDTASNYINSYIQGQLPMTVTTI